MGAGIKEKVLAGFILGLISIGLIGYQVHNQMTNLASSLYSNQYQNNLVKYQKILSTLSDAESSVRTFSITNNDQDLEQFHLSRNMLLDYIPSINQVKKNNDELSKLNKLIHSKIMLMEEMISVRRDNPSEDLLERALDKINEIKYKEQPKDPVEKEDLNSKTLTEPKGQDASAFQELKKEENEDDDLSLSEKNQNKEENENKGFFQKLFSRKKADTDKLAEKSEKEEINEEKEVDRSTHPDKDSSSFKKSNQPAEEIEKTEEIESSIHQLQVQNKLKTTVWQDNMLRLIKEDNKIMRRIRIEMAKLEKKEKHNQEHFISTAARSKDSIINNTTVMGVGAFTIILILSLVIVQDFDRLRKNRLSLISEKEKANRHAKVKEEFLANMSHEIRTPMNAIVGYSELLQKTTLTSEQKDFLSTIQKSSNHLMVILNDILDYSKLESGKLIIHKEQFNPVICVNQVVKSMEADAVKKGIKIHKFISPSVHKNLMGDAIRFQQILYNLLSNAIKFTDKGAVSVVLKSEDFDSEAVLKLSVKDTGSGIGPEHLQRIFENFEQVDTGRKRKFGGTGLGLAIIKRLVNLHNGEIEVKSEEGKGSEFIIQIPYEISKIKDVNRKPKAKKEEIKLNNLKILAVDDQEYNLELINLILKKWGASVKLATSGKDALEKIKNDEFNIILMDVQMPEMTGIEATRAIRKNDKELPIIALTAASTKEETDRCLSAGMDDFLLKPFKQNELYDILKKYASKNNSDETRCPQIQCAFENLYNLANGNIAFVNDMLQVFLKNSKNDFEKLEQHVKEKNYIGIHRMAHKMIPPCRHLKINHLVSKLDEIEKRALKEENINSISSLTEEARNILGEALICVKNEIDKLHQK